MNSRWPCTLSLLFVAAHWLDAAELEGRARFERTLAELVEKSGMQAGYAIKDLVQGDEFIRGGDTVFPQGSSIRIHLIAELFRQAAAGKFSVNEVRPLPEAARVGGYGVLRFMDARVALTLRDYAVLTITVNDNTAANFLTDIVGIENVNASLEAQGTPEIRFRRKAISRREAAPNLPENVGTPRSVMRALELIYRGAVVDRATSDAILEVLALPEISYFQRELPPGVKFAGRSGSGPSFRCDEGIVLLEKRPYVFCVMIKDLASGPSLRRREYSRADGLIGQISRAAIEYFDPAAMRSTDRAARP